MPMMPRIHGVSQRIAYAINGIPANIAAKRTAKERAIDRRLVYVNAYRLK